MTRPAGERARAALLPQLVKFAGVGAVGLLINLVVFNALRMSVFDPAVLAHGPLYATMVATVVAIAANWVGNRYWAFSAGRQKSAVREGGEFFLVSLVGMGIPLLCLWISHYLLGFTSLLADNVASNLVGLALGTVFRFALYRWWVFAPERHAPASAPTSASAPAASVPESALLPD